MISGIKRSRVYVNRVLLIVLIVLGLICELIVGLFCRFGVLGDADEPGGLVFRYIIV